MERNVRKGKAIPLWLAISRFWGLPMGVIVLPIFIPIAIEINTMDGLTLKWLEMDIAKGIRRMAAVSFTTKAARNPDIHMITKMIYSTFLILDKTVPTIWFITPDLSRAEVILNIPKRNTITWKLIDFKADSIGIIPNPKTRIAPIDIITQNGRLFSLVLTIIRK